MFVGSRRGGPWITDKRSEKRPALMAPKEPARRLPALIASTTMILTPLAMRRASFGLGFGGDQPSPGRQSQQLLDVPRLDLRVLDHHEKQHQKPPPSGEVSRPKSRGQSDGSLREIVVPTSNDALLNSESQTSAGEESKEEAEEEPNGAAKVDLAKWVQIIRVLLPHTVLAVAVVLYTMIGAAIFYAIERPNEEDHKTQIVERMRRTREEYLDRMWNMSQNDSMVDKEFLDQGVAELESVLKEMFRAFEEGVTDSALNHEPLKLSWTYTEAVIFAATVITTIGYGNLVPKTFWGRLFCIVYALLGIPLALVTIADIGKFVGTAITWSYETMETAVERAFDGCRLFFGRLFDRMHPGRRKSRQSSILVARKSNNSRRRSSAWSGKGSLGLQSSDGTGLTTTGGGRRNSTTRRKSTASEVRNNNTESNNTENDLDETRGDEEIKEDTKTQSASGADDLDEEEEEEQEEEEAAVSDLPVPPSFILMIVVGYTAVSSFLFAQWEEWVYLDSFYFCLITVTTVGFGDLVPSEKSNAAFVLLFIFLGLVLATMCIDLVGTHYISKIHYMGRKLQDAKSALAFIGGKAVNMTAWTKHMKKMQKQFGMSDEQVRRLMENPDEYMQLMEAARLGLKGRGSLRAFAPQEAAKMRYIDQNGGTASEYSPTTPSQLLALSTGRGSSIATQASVKLMISDLIT